MVDVFRHRPVGPASGTGRPSGRVRPGRPSGPDGPGEPGRPGPPRRLGRLGRPLRHPAAAPLATLGAALAASFYLYGTDPHHSGHWLPRCPFNWSTGLLCPACGATRLAYDLLHGDPVRAFHENALLLVLSPAVVWMGGRRLVEGLRGRRWRPVLGARAQYALMGVAAGWTVVRNLR